MSKKQLRAKGKLFKTSSTLRSSGLPNQLSASLPLTASVLPTAPILSSEKSIPVAPEEYATSKEEPAFDDSNVSADSASTANSELDLSTSAVENAPADPEMRSKVSGFRLQSFEVYNWGTFHGQVWKLNLDCKNALLTGDIGSGKSTFVDAITTLLFPANKIAYNKAAGAETKERTLRTYVMGYHKSERNESGSSSKPVALRDNNSYSVILGTFHNQDYDQTVTLAQVFWMKEPTGMPARFYVAAERALSINGDFDKFGTDIGKLTKRLKSQGCEVFDSFPPYGAWYRRRFGIASDQAMELFHQTVSMKSVGNLTDFVRKHMLEPFDVKERLEALISHFDNLNTAHESVLKAELQISMLTPIIEDCENRSKVKERSDELRACRDALKTFFASLKLDLISKRIENLNEEWTRLNNQINKSDQHIVAQRKEESDLKRNIAENGGDRIEQLTNQIQQKEIERDKRKVKATKYGEFVSDLDIQPATNLNAFSLQINSLRPLLEKTELREAEVQNDLSELSLKFRQGKEEHKTISDEIASLRSRKSNIPSTQIRIRDQICRAFQLQEDDLPFAGELLKVHDDELDWEGAAERALRGFGLSLLVPDEYYSSVAEWVDSTHLKDRIVYFRIRDKKHDYNTPRPNSLASKIAIKTDSIFYDWLGSELERRFNHICCRTQEEFRRQTVAITVSGQMKTPGERHEKDDRHHIGDRSRYVLGWTNAAKIDALQASLKSLEVDLQKLGDIIAVLQSEQKTLRHRLSILNKLEEYNDFDEIDWQSVAIEIESLCKEKKELESASNLLITLTERLTVLQTEISKNQKEMEQLKAERAKTEQKVSDQKLSLNDTEAIVSDPSNQKHKERFELLDSMKAEALGEHTLSIESCFNREHDMREWLQAKIDSEDGKLRTIDHRIVGAMQKYNDKFPAETKEVDAHIESANEYARMLAELRINDLPRFKTKFKEMLNENAINEIANFQSQLNRERELIRARIAHINKSLTEIKFTAETFIVLEASPSTDAEIRDFQTDLRTCTEGALSGSDDEEYSEAKFLEVKRIIERFRGKEGSTNADQEWTERVTDVRNWFTFAASERWFEDESEREHYSDSSGKSGGQKEKLAYTILAASLAYQFGLDMGVPRSRTFRFVVIDEAFGRGSDDSAHYGLSLFGKMGLQLLVVTPLQKIHVIDPFVHNVGFVHNVAGKESMLRNLTIEEYHAEQAARSNKDTGVS